MYRYPNTVNRLRSVWWASFLFLVTSGMAQEPKFPKPRNGKVYVIAHRGAHDVFPENTLAAYQRAIDLGCDFVEIDLRMTKDGHLVSVHNADVDAYVNGFTGKVRDFTLAELRAMPLKKATVHSSQERIPTLSEILELCRGRIGIYFDVKDADILSQTRLVKRFGMERQVVWYLPGTDIAAISELTALCDSCIPMPDLGALADSGAFLDRMRPEVIAGDMDQLNPAYITLAHDRGIKVFVDDRKHSKREWMEMVALGVDGIQTDRPEELIKFIRRNVK